MGLALVVEQIGDLFGYCGHDGGVEQGVQTSQQQSADDDSDENLDAGVHIALGLLVGNGYLSAGGHGIELLTDVCDKLLHK